MSKTVVITGAGGVLCSAFAVNLAKLGHRVALLDIQLPAAEKVAQQIREAGGCAKAYACDVLSRETVDTVHTQILADFGPCDILINGAGGNNPRCTTAGETYTAGDENVADKLTFFNLPKEGFDFVFDLNLKGVLIPSQVFMADMLGRTGCSVLNISSMNAYRPLTKIPAYSAAKAAVTNFTSWLAVHFAEAGIRVNAIAPGFFLTEQNRALQFNPDGTPSPRQQKIIAGTPMGRYGKLEELIGAMLFLVSEKASGFVTGVVLPVDGGFNVYSGV